MSDEVCEHQDGDSLDMSHGAFGHECRVCLESFPYPEDCETCAFDEAADIVGDQREQLRVLQDRFDVAEGYRLLGEQEIERLCNDLAAAKAQGAAEERLLTLASGKSALVSLEAAADAARGQAPLIQAGFDAAAASLRQFLKGIERGDHIKQETKPNE